MITTFIAGASMVISAYIIVVIFNKGLYLYGCNNQLYFYNEYIFLIRFISGKWKKIKVI